MSDDDRRTAELIAQLVGDRIDRRWPDPDTHRKHHIWTEEKMRESEMVIGRKHRVIDYVAGSAVVGFLGWLGYVVLDKLNLG